VEQNKTAKHSTSNVLTTQQTSLRPLTHAPETGCGNRRQKSAS